MSEREILELRAKVDFIDKEIVRHLNERARAVLEIKRLKQGDNVALYDPKREEQIMANAVANNEGPLYDDTIRELFQRIIHEIRSLESE